MMPKILFFTAANQAYEDFVPLYAFSILSHVTDSAVEIAVEDTAGFYARHGAAAALLADCFGKNKLVVRNTRWTLPDRRRILPNTVRFITPPTIESDYVYIGDIDIIVLETNLLAMHLRHMELTGLPYSNSVRPTTMRMSGLHFTRTTAYYPLPDVSDLDLNGMNDEMVLYEIVRRRGLAVQDGAWYRPIHGIHISPNRPPEQILDESGNVVVPGWGINPYARQWQRMSANTEFRRLRPLLSARVQDALNRIDSIVAAIRPEGRAETAPTRSESSIGALLPQQVTLKSTGDWSGQPFIVEPLPAGSAVRFSIQPNQPCGTIDLHVLLRNQSDPTRYRWLMVFRGEPTEARDFQVGVDFFTAVNGAALDECNELIIRIRATGAMAAELILSNVQIIRPSSGSRPSPPSRSGRAAPLSRLARNAAQRRDTPGKPSLASPSRGIVAVRPGLGALAGGEEIAIYVAASALAGGRIEAPVRVRFDGWSAFAYAPEVKDVAFDGTNWCVRAITPLLPAAQTVRKQLGEECQAYSQCVDVVIETAGRLIGGGAFAFLRSPPAPGDPILLHAGSDTDAIPGWINLDRRPIRAQGEEIVLWEFHHGFRMIENDSVDAITISHMLMYIPTSEHEAFFEDCFRVLKCGGVLRLTEDNCSVRPEFNTHYYMGPTSPVAMRQALEAVGFSAHDQYPDTTLSSHRSIMRARHMELWDEVTFEREGKCGIYFMEGVKPHLHYQIGTLTLAHPLEAQAALAQENAHLRPSANPVFSIGNITSRISAFAADPFVVEVEDQLHLFYEDRSPDKGIISTARSADGLEWEDIGPALTEPFHLSFPYVFAWSSRYYMIPETSQATEVRLYVADDFPLGWRQEATLLSGRSFVDNCIVRYDGLWWLFTCIDNQLEVHFSEALSGPYQPHPMNPVCSSFRHARPGGRIIEVDGKLMRFSQNCTRSYGESIASHWIEKLTPNDYAERLHVDPFLSGPNPNQYVAWNTKVHHVDFCWRRRSGGWLAVFDGTSLQADRLREFRPAKIF